MAESVFDLKAARVNEDYIVEQVYAIKQSRFWQEHKARIAAFDTVYGGSLEGLTPEENKLDNVPYVENKLKNAAHDIKRLAREAKGVPVFVKEGEDDLSATRARVRAAIADTIWEEGGAADLEGRLYLDLIAGGFAALAVYYNSRNDYPQFLRLNPRHAYPTVSNGKLVDVFYIEEIKERAAADLFPDLGLTPDPKNTRTIELVMCFTKDEVCQAIIQKAGGGRSKATMTSDSWRHGLDVVPVAFRAIDTVDDDFRGLLDQLPGPLKARNRAMRLMLDYLEDMVNAPYFEEGVLNSDTPPGPTTIYHADPDYDGPRQITRVPPAAPASAVFGLLNYLDSQEASEGFQPPARVGTVRQSIASGNFVESTQGSLSSVVLEMQEYVARIRRDANKVAMMVDEKFLDREKPLVRSVGQKTTYRPKKDIGGWYYHKIMYGAAAGLDRREADTRILQHLGAGLIDPGAAREQTDYIENDPNIQDDVDRALLRKVEFQKLISDPTVTFADMAEIDRALGEGKPWHEAVGTILERLLERQKAVEQAATQAGPQAAEGMPPEAERMMLEKGAAPGAEALELPEFAPPPFTQIIAS